MPPLAQSRPARRCLVAALCRILGDERIAYHRGLRISGSAGARHLPEYAGILPRHERTVVCGRLDPMQRLAGAGNDRQHEIRHGVEILDKRWNVIQAAKGSF